MQKGKLHTVPQVARMVGITTQAVHARIKTGHVRAEQVAGRLWVITESEIDRLRKSGQLRKMHPVIDRDKYNA
jgi:hypothetical protein